MFGNHAEVGDGKAVTSSIGICGTTCLVSNQFYVMAHMQFEINTAGGDFENLTSAIFRNRVVAIRSSQATFNVGRVRVAGSFGGLRKPQRHQQGRYNHQQQYSFHGILLRFPPCGGPRFHLGFDFAVGPYAERLRVVHRLSSGLGTWSIRSGTAQTLSGMDWPVCSQPLIFDAAASLGKVRVGRHNPALICSRIR
jgi:hypothetical protein